MLLAGLTWFLARRVRWPAPQFGDLVAIYLVAIGSHIFLDVITSFGTMVWSPLNYSRVSWDFVLIVDLTLTSLALMPQLAAWAFRPLKDPWKRAVPLWAIFSAAAFAIGPLVRPLNIPFSDGRVVLRHGRLGLLFSAPAPAQQRFPRWPRQVVPHRIRSGRRLLELRRRHAPFRLPARFRIRHARRA